MQSLASSACQVKRGACVNFAAPIKFQQVAQVTRDPQRGQRLGKYEILRKLAIGGMAELFLGRAAGVPNFPKPLVLKRILPTYATNHDFITMFLDEARIALTLRHPNIVQTYDVGEANGSYFIAMEYLFG